jgi:uncharacterized protein (DUF433 family)
MNPTSKRGSLALGKYIVADPAVCHGKPTFKGTRVMVHQVLEQVAHGTPWERIVWSWRGKVPIEAITEAIELASGHFEKMTLTHGRPGRKRRTKSGGCVKAALRRA